MKIQFLYRLLLVFVLTTSFYNCSKKEETIPENIKINHFVWKGMNAYYLWNAEVSDLSDKRFSTQNQLNSYLFGFENPRTLFDNLLYQKGNVDKFSWIVDDYIALENSFQGITLNNGMEFGLVRFKSPQSNVFGYVRYVVKGSEAATKGVKRGMIFSEIDGVQIDENNYRSLISKSSYTIGLANYNDGNPSTNGTTIQLIKSKLQENPILVSKVITEGTKKIGYLMYNQFASSYNGALNAEFAKFKGNIDELIIDLRYNGGGSVATATYLGGMVTGQFDGQVFSKQRWNKKVMSAVKPERFIDRFTNQLNNNGTVETINNLNLKRVYFIVSGSSASASELIINSLKPYIDVKVIGTTTYGKHVGSITLYDSDNYRRNGANLKTNHTWAMQPIVLEIVNKKDENSPNGIQPNIELKEDYSNLGVLGEKSDPLLERTLNYITTGKKTSAKSSNFIQLEEIAGSKTLLPNYNNMYVDFKK